MSPAPAILVLAGVNGAGKSSVGGALLQQRGLHYFNPDEAAKRIRAATRYTSEEANSLAWQEGKERLEAAIHGRSSYAFESTLAGRTIPSLLVEASSAGIDIFAWFVGLATPEQHIERVRARVAAGGHDIPEALIRQRWDRSRRNILKLLPHLAELKIFDNSAEGDPASGLLPEPRLLLHRRGGSVAGPNAQSLATTPEWAKPIVAGALRLSRSPR